MIRLSDSQEIHSLSADFLQETGSNLDGFVGTMTPVLSLLEQALPVEMLYLLERVHEAMNELVAIVDTVIAGENVLLSLPEFSEIYRSKLSQITLRLYQLQRRVCEEHHAALDALQTDVLHLGLN